MPIVSLGDFFHTHHLNFLIYVLMNPNSKPCIKPVSKLCSQVSLYLMLDLNQDVPQIHQNSTGPKVNWFVLSRSSYLREYPSLSSCPSYRYGSPPDSPPSLTLMHSVIKFFWVYPPHKSLKFFLFLSYSYYCFCTDINHFWSRPSLLSIFLFCFTFSHLQFSPLTPGKWFSYKSYQSPEQKFGSLSSCSL